MMDALRTVSNLYSIPPSSTSQSQPEETELDEDDWSDLDSDSLPQGPDEQLQQHGPRSNGVDETASRARKNLERDVENKLAEGNRHFLKAFAEVDQVCRSLVGCMTGSFTWCFPSTLSRN